MGEIGISRHEALYELLGWEIHAIIKGNQRRHHPGWEQARLVAYCAAHAMGGEKHPKPLDQWIRFPWEEGTAAEVDEDEVADLRNLMKRMRANSKKKKKSASSS